MLIPSASSKIIFTTFKFFWACSIFFEHSQIFWSRSKARFYLINSHFWAWSKTNFPWICLGGKVIFEQRIILQKRISKNCRIDCLLVFLPEGNSSAGLFYIYKDYAQNSGTEPNESAKIKERSYPSDIWTINNNSISCVSKPKR